MPYKLEPHEKKEKNVLLFGKPKGGGKSTFAFTAEPGPTIVLNYDGGDPGIPPGVTHDIWIQNYPVTDLKINPKNHKWDRSGKTGSQYIHDILDIRDALLNGKDHVNLRDWYADPSGQTTIQIPRPSTIICDGLVNFNSELLNWLMSGEGYKDAQGLQKGDAFKFWGMRLDRMNVLFSYLLPLPANVILVTWQTQDKDASGTPIGDVYPDIGGKMSEWAAGKVDATLHCYNDSKIVAGKREVRYYVSTAPTDKIPSLGVRGVYGLPSRVDVTIREEDVGKPGYQSPWNRVWNRAIKRKTK